MTNVPLELSMIEVDRERGGDDVKDEDRTPRGVSRRTALGGIGALIAAAGVGSVVLTDARSADAATGWGGYANGQIPTSALASVAGVLLHPEAASSMTRLRTAYASALGTTLGITEGYRDLARQQYLYNEYKAGRGNLAAVPGTSNHGWATAVDFSFPITVAGTPGHNWLKANSRAYGWWWAGGTFSQVEPWHWEYVLGSATVPNQPTTPKPPEDDDMGKVVMIGDNTGLWLADIGAKTKYNIAMGGLDAASGIARKDVFVAMGIPFYDKQSGILLAGFTDITSKNAPYA